MMTTLMMKVQIQRRLAPVQPYARSGNRGFQKPVFVFSVFVNGRIVGGPYTRLSKAMELAKDYDPFADRSYIVRVD